MARSRNIKPGFFTNDQLAEIEPLGRLLFAGLWTLADREGRLLDRPKKIKAEILPYDDCNVNVLLERLALDGFIRRYQVDGTAYLEIVNWHKHQSPHIKEAPSDIPAPPDSHTGAVGDSSASHQEPAPVEHQTNTVPTPDEHELSRPDSLNLIPDSPNPPNPPAGGAPPPRLLPRGQLPKAEQERFDRFWRAYPRRESKAEAVRWWQRHRPDDPLVAAMLDAIARKIQSADWQKEGGRFIPLPPTWLNQRRWEDEPPDPIRSLPHNHPAVARSLKVYD